ncbi:protein ITPRID2 isoform X2 [Larimichthys crocea]|uniref:protein ITPRID2 isoform X2 n=1 Tax=Larimichthys crocea TaxID=215358 RepID=UPI000F5FF7D5|nr:protein ITPRID2 isoform X2 [Larimichthys crocea]
MESGGVGIDTSTAPDLGGQSERIACLRRRAWAKSRDSIWQEPEPEHCGPQSPQQNQRDMEAESPAGEPGQVPNKITSWLIECRTPIGASLDDQSASPSKGGLRNGCSFEDDLSLGAEANHLHSKNKTESCVSELLDLYEEDPEEVLLNLGFGREEPDLASKVPSRFINSASSARGIDIKVYLGAQMQRMELENPNYALTSRFRQIEVLTTVANEFFQLYSQVSGQPVQRISSKDQVCPSGGEVGEAGGGEPPPLKKSNSALNVAKLLKKSISKHNLNAAAAESPQAHTPNQPTHPNVHAPSDYTNTNGHVHTSPEPNGCNTDPDQVETVSQKHNRKKDSCSLATVTEETNGDGETDDSAEQCSTGPTANEEHQPASTDFQSTNQKTKEGTQVVKEEEKNLTSTPEKTPPILAPPQLAQLRTENTDSFDMEEIQDEALPHRTSGPSDLLRTVSQQSDSSGFAEEPSADSNSSLKVQESSDSCDSETTVTSHPSQDMGTPLAVDQPAFVLPEVAEKEAESSAAAEGDEESSPKEEKEHDGSLEQIPQYIGHQFLFNKPMEMQQDEEQVESGDQADPDPEPEPELREITQSMSAVEQKPQPELEHMENQSTSKQDTSIQTETTSDTEPPTDGVDAEDVAQEEKVFLDYSGLIRPPVASSPVLDALKRAKQNQMGRAGQWDDPQSGSTSPVPGRGRGRGQGRGRGRGDIPLQRSSSLPSSYLSPSRVVSSVRIQFGQGQTSCTQPRYSFKYSQQAEGDKGEQEKEEEEEEGQTNCLSTLIINPASSSNSNKQPRLLTEATPKPIPRYLMQSSHSLRSSSPPPDWSPGGHAHPWITQSVPDLSSSAQQPGHFDQKMNANKNQQSWKPGQMMYPCPNPNPYPTAQYPSPSPNPSPGPNPNPYPYTPNPHPQYPSSLQPYTSLPNLLHLHNPSMIHDSSLTSLHQPTTTTIPQHSNLSNLYQHSTSSAPHHANLGNLHPGTPVMHHQVYNHQYSHHSPYHAAPHGSPYLSYHGYNLNPHLPFPYPVTQYLPEHSLHPGLTPPAPGFLPGMASTLGPDHSLHPSYSFQSGLTPPAPGFLPGMPSTLGPGHSPYQRPTPPAPSSTEMQLRKVLHDIRGTVKSLSQSRADTPDAVSEPRAAMPSDQSLAEFQQKRRSLNLFRSQMMDLELSIIHQQALVYKHLSPADRLELEQLQSLRSSVREELRELEQQLEDRLIELTHHTQHRGLHRDNSFDSLSTASALRAMEPVSDLLREQLLLQSEISYSGHAPSTNPSSRSSSPVRGGDREQSGGVYRTSINITPIPPRRPNTHAEEEEREEEEQERDDGGGGGGGGIPEEEGASGGVRVENLQQLIREIRASVAQEVRREIYGELLATMSPGQPSLPARQQPL